MKEYFTPKVITNSPEQHKEEIEKQLKQLQVLFCDRLYQKFKHGCQKDGKPIDKTFSDFLEGYGVQFAGELRKLAIISSGKELTEKEQDDLVVEKYYREINRLYDGLPEDNANDISPEYIQSRIL